MFRLSVARAPWRSIPRRTRFFWCRQNSARAPPQAQIIRAHGRRFCRTVSWCWWLGDSGSDHVRYLQAISQMARQPVPQIGAVIAFHAQAGRSQVVSLSFLFVTRFFSAELPTVATLPSALFDERVFSVCEPCAFPFQPLVPPDCRPPVPSEMEVGPGD